MTTPNELRATSGMKDLADFGVDCLVRDGKAIRDGDTVRLNPFYVYVKGLADIRIGAPPGVHTEAHVAKRLREIRNGARLLIEPAPTQGA